MLEAWLRNAVEAWILWFWIFESIFSAGVWLAHFNIDKTSGSFCFSFVLFWELLESGWELTCFEEFLIAESIDYWGVCFAQLNIARTPGSLALGSRVVVGTELVFWV